jgi:hypothetical protein
MMFIDINGEEFREEFKGSRLYNVVKLPEVENARFHTIYLITGKDLRKQLISMKSVYSLVIPDNDKYYMFYYNGESYIRISPREK